jgi:hypothetical protein
MIGAKAGKHIVGLLEADDAKLRVLSDTQTVTRCKCLVLIGRIMKSHPIDFLHQWWCF